MSTEEMAVQADPEQTLKSRFGMESFRSGQRAVIDALLEGRSAAAVFPTGGGKSLCYQLPALLLPGTTVVVSPLIALMKDQVDQLAARGIRAARLDSSLTEEEFHAVTEGVRRGKIKILYAAPERFFNERFRASLEGLRISLFAIDEAHCISQWGHNFRPDYLKLAEVARRVKAERVLALTATATPPVLEDICQAFEIAAEDAVRTPFYRPNLELRTTIVTLKEQEDVLLERITSRESGPGLVYVSQQHTAERVAEKLVAAGLQARAYHAGMDAEQRAEVQQWFLGAAEGIVVATIAFGMGIDKPDIRYVYHFNPPKSLESYAQEIGRAGRDGEPAVCELLLAIEDRVVLDNFVYGDTPDRQAIDCFVDLIAGQPDSFYVSHYRLSQECDIRVLVLRTLLTYLELEGYLEGTSPRYDSYRFKPQTSSQKILDALQGERRRFAAGVLSMSRKGRTWFTIDIPAVVKRLNTTRGRVIKALDYFARQGWMEVQASELVHGYRKRTPIKNVKTLADDLDQRLRKREQTEIERIDRIVQFATADRCLSGQLSAYFGEPLSERCGTCTSCRGEGNHDLPRRPARSIGTSARDAVRTLAKQYPDLLGSPRQQAKVLCGLSSPALVRARVTRDSAFGLCDRFPFADVMQELGS